jgi:hypothetical protein
LGYWPAPKYFTDERIEYPRPHQRYLWGGGGTERGEWKSIEMKWKHFISGGVFNRAVIDPNAAVVYSDPDNDTINELFTITIPTSVTDVKEIAIYFTSTDRLGYPLSEQWRIRPIDVVISGGNVTITGHTAQLVLPAVVLGLYPQQLDASVAGNFAANMEVHRVFTDTTATDSFPYQGVAIWNILPPQSVTGQFTIVPLTLAENDNEGARVFATFGSPCTWPFNREPDRIQTNYIAGYPTDANGHMALEMAQAVTYLAVSLLATESCGCERVNRIIDSFRKPLSQDDAQRFYTQREIDQNPFSAIPSRGSLAAWKRVSRLRHVEMVGL